MKSQLDAGRLAAAESYWKATDHLSDVLQLVSEACDVPMAAFKSTTRNGTQFALTHGIPGTPTPSHRGVLYDLVAAERAAIVIPDANRDPRVAGHPLIAGSARVRFVAGVPLFADGYVIGALYAFDTRARRLDVSTLRSILTRIGRRFDNESGLRRSMPNPWPKGTQGANRDEIIAVVAHEIRTPLAVIHGYLELLADTPGAIADEHRPQVDAINRNAARLCRTVDHLLSAMSRSDAQPAQQWDDVDTGKLVQSCVADMHGRARVALTLPAVPLWIRADPDLLRSAVENLILNALAYSDAGEPVDVVVAGDQHIIIEVHDRGVGVAPDELSRLGQPFFRGRHSRAAELPGLGLGLAITEQIVTAHGGSLVLSSEPGTGTIARIVLPHHAGTHRDVSRTDHRPLARS